MTPRRAEDDPRLDPQIKVVMAARDKVMATANIPSDASHAERRLIMDALTMPDPAEAPAMAAVEDHWLPVRGRRIQTRLYRPAGNGALPVAVYLHGGGWVMSSIETHDPVARAYALAGGCAVLSVDYALAPESRFPIAIEECVGVVRHVARHGSELGLDPERIVVCGDSAGGNLAFATALVLRDMGGPQLCGVATAYPICDSRLDTESYREFAEGYGLTAAAMAAFWDAYVTHPFERTNPLAAPLRADLAGFPPVLLHVAELDVLRSEGEAMAARLAAAGVPVEHAVIPGMTHGFMRSTVSVDRARQAAEAAGVWLKSIMS